MRRKKKTTIVTFESRERVTIRSGVRQMIAWCEQCGAEVLMVSPDEGAAVRNTDAQEIFRGVEAGTIHFIESEGGGLMICSNSLNSEQ